ncbi:MAG TPA: hypothetical protein VEV84_05235 [Pyrinomonadaceae bacterium]|nr:hypothetical protein [Pyrinomonadaceae bacterium]
MKFARYTFLISGIYGLIVLLPQYFLENKIGIDQPPAITHPEFFYGFVSVAVAFQFVFLVIASDPVKYRALMLVSLFEKFPFFFAVLALYLQSRVGWQMLAAASIDCFWGLMFLVSFLKTRSAQTMS